MRTEYIDNMHHFEDGRGEEITILLSSKCVARLLKKQPSINEKFARDTVNEAIICEKARVMYIFEMSSVKLLEKPGILENFSKQTKLV